MSIDTQATPLFAPVRIASASAVGPAPELPPRQLAPPRRRTSIIEITLANGRVVKVDEGIEPQALARIVAALDGGGLE
jgi:hypothetical protein